MSLTYVATLTQARTLNVFLLSGKIFSSEYSCSSIPILNSKSLGVGRLFASGKVAPVVYSEVWPLERAADGLAALEKRQTWGKAVVRIREEDGVKAKL